MDPLVSKCFFSLSSVIFLGRFFTIILEDTNEACCFGREPSAERPTAEASTSILWIPGLIVGAPAEVSLEMGARDCDENTQPIEPNDGASKKRYHQITKAGPPSRAELEERKRKLAEWKRDRQLRKNPKLYLLEFSYNLF